MTPERDRRFDLLDEAVESTEGARTIDAALAALIGVVGVPFAIRQAAVLLLRDGDLVIVANWSAGESPFEAGMEISLGLTEPLRTLAERIRSERRPFAVRVAEADLGLLNDMLATQNIHSWIAVPLQRARSVVGAITFASVDEDAFPAEILPLFTGIAHGVEDRLLDLLGGRA